MRVIFLQFLVGFVFDLSTFKYVANTRQCSNPHPKVKSVLRVNICYKLPRAGTKVSSFHAQWSKKILNSSVRFALRVNICIKDTRTDNKVSHVNALQTQNINKVQVRPSSSTVRLGKCVSVWIFNRVYIFLVMCNSINACIWLGNERRRFPLGTAHCR